MKTPKEQKMIKTTLVQRASNTRRTNGFYLVKNEKKELIGTIEKPYHSDVYRAHSHLTDNNETSSSKDSAESFIIQEELNFDL